MTSQPILCCFDGVAIGVAGLVGVWLALVSENHQNVSAM